MYTIVMNKPVHAVIMTSDPTRLRDGSYADAARHIDALVKVQGSLSETSAEKILSFVAQLVGIVEKEGPQALERVRLVKG